MSEPSFPTYYPVFLSLKGRRCVVVGGGPIAEAKVRNLIKHPCEVVLISPNATKSLAEWAKAGRIVWERREYCEGTWMGRFWPLARRESLRWTGSCRKRRNESGCC